MKARYSCTPGSSTYLGSVGSLIDVAVIKPVEFSIPAGFSTVEIDAAVVLMKCTGFQPSSATFRIASAPNRGVEKLTKISAPDAFSLPICESMVGSELS